jgi:hypothetical protein
MLRLQEPERYVLGFGHGDWQLFGTGFPSSAGCRPGLPKARAKLSLLHHDFEGGKGKMGMPGTVIDPEFEPSSLRLPEASVTRPADVDR